MFLMLKKPCLLFLSWFSASVVVGFAASVVVGFAASVVVGFAAPL